MTLPYEQPTNPEDELLQRQRTLKDAGLLAELARDPYDSETMPQIERERAEVSASQESGMDKARGWRIGGTPENAYWAAEHKRVMTMSGPLSIRGEFEEVDPDNLTPDQQIARIGGFTGGKLSHVILETDQGEKILIEKTTPPDIESAKDQKFRMATIGLNGFEDAVSESVASEDLANVVAVAGVPLTIGGKAKDGSYHQVLKTRGRVSRMVGVQLNSGGKVAAGHPRLAKAFAPNSDRYLDIDAELAQFSSEGASKNKEQTTGTGGVASNLGKAAMGQTVAGGAEQKKNGGAAEDRRQWSGRGTRGNSRTNATNKNGDDAGRPERPKNDEPKAPRAEPKPASNGAEQPTKGETTGTKRTPETPTLRLVKDGEPTTSTTETGTPAPEANGEKDLLQKRIEGLQNAYKKHYNDQLNSGRNMKDFGFLATLGGYEKTLGTLQGDLAKLEAGSDAEKTKQAVEAQKGNFEADLAQVYGSHEKAQEAAPRFFNRLKREMGRVRRLMARNVAAVQAEQNDPNVGRFTKAFDRVTVLGAAALLRVPPSEEPRPVYLYDFTRLTAESFEAAKRRAEEEKESADSKHSKAAQRKIASRATRS